jgi:lipopolysaccharide transport system ATP-binding protein
MSDVAICVEGLGKRYRIGKREPYLSLRDSLARAAKAPWHTLRRLATGANGTHSDPDDKSFWALKDVNFEIRRGEVVGIIGRNGAGKSTLLKILSEITEPTTGTVDVYGRVGSLLEVGTGFHPELTGRENVYLNGAILGMTRKEIDRKFDEIVAFAEVERFLDTPVKHYSSGMYTRLAFAIASHLEPEILIVDEVLAVGDVAFQKKCLGKMGDVAKHGRTIFFVSHNIKVIEVLCTRGLVLEGGQIALDGPASLAAHTYRTICDSDAQAVYHAHSPALQWQGLRNRNSLENLKPNEDICLVLTFRSGARPLNRTHVDIALSNEKGEIVIHAISQYVSDGISIPAETDIEVEYIIQSPKLAGGSYRLTVYACNGGETLVWVDNIDACRIVPKPYFGKAEFFDNLKAAIIPEYGISYRTKEPK